MAEGVKIAARNQKAFHEYFIDEKFEAGIELTGTEVKSIRLGTLSLKEAWCQIKDGQLFIRQMHIAPYEQGNIFNKDPRRPCRRLRDRDGAGSHAADRGNHAAVRPEMRRSAAGAGSADRRKAVTAKFPLAF